MPFTWTDILQRTRSRWARGRSSPTTVTSSVPPTAASPLSEPPVLSSSIFPTIPSLITPLTQSLFRAANARSNSALRIPFRLTIQLQVIPYYIADDWMRFSNTLEIPLCLTRRQLATLEVLGDANGISDPSSQDIAGAADSMVSALRAWWFGEFPSSKPSTRPSKPLATDQIGWWIAGTANSSNGSQKRSAGGEPDDTSTT